MDAPSQRNRAHRQSAEQKPGCQLRTSRTRGRKPPRHRCCRHSRPHRWRPALHRGNDTFHRGGRDELEFNSDPGDTAGLLLARLDRLGVDAKEIAQIAATIGREFDRSLLCMIADKPAEEVVSALGRLAASQIVLPGRSLRGGNFLFRHALIQEAAYQSLLLSRRRQYHKRIAEVLELVFLKSLRSQPS